jgi:hypothetical protein
MGSLHVGCHGGICVQQVHQALSSLMSARLNGNRSMTTATLNALTQLRPMYTAYDEGMFSCSRRLHRWMGALGRYEGHLEHAPWQPFMPAKRLTKHSLVETLDLTGHRFLGMQTAGSTLGSALSPSNHAIGGELLPCCTSPAALA